MELKQVWMSRDTQKQSRYSLRTLGGILGIAMLALVLVLGGTALGFMLGWPMRLVSVGLWLGVTVLLVALALRLGQNAVRDATLYFLTRDDRLFVADARQLAGMGHSALDWAKGTVRVQQRLREMARSPVLPAAAEEILRVEQIRENRTGYAVTCQLRRFDQTVTRHTCFVIRGLEDQETLLHLLELREGWSGSPELRENHTLHGLLLSILAAGVAGVLCVLSHPAVGQLPVGIYYPAWQRRSGRSAARYGSGCGSTGANERHKEAQNGLHQRKTPGGQTADRLHPAQAAGNGQDAGGEGESQPV